MHMHMHMYMKSCMCTLLSCMKMTPEIHTIKVLFNRTYDTHMTTYLLHTVYPMLMAVTLQSVSLVAVLKVRESSFIRMYS